MRARISLLVVMLASLLMVNFGASAVAQTASDTTTTTNTSQTTTADRDARIEQRKAALKKAPTKIEIAKLQAKCVAAQAILQRANTQSTQAATNRTKAYDNIQTRLASLIAKLESQNVPTAELRNAKTALASKVDTFNIDVKTYQQALSDSAGMGCAGDPTGFKASLESTRTAREQVRNDAEDIHVYVSQTIKPILKTVKDQLQTTASKGSQ